MCPEEKQPEAALGPRNLQLLCWKQGLGHLRHCQKVLLMGNLNRSPCASPELTGAEPWHSRVWAVLPITPGSWGATAPCLPVGAQGTRSVEKPQR